ncbi:hypothetical protein Tco_0620118 [Tanacetum coccineum]
MNMDQERHMQMVGGNGGNWFRQYANDMIRESDLAVCMTTSRRRDVAYLQLLMAQKEEAGIQIQAEEFDLMAVAIDCEEVEEVNANCNLMANLQQSSTSCTHANKIHIYDSNGIARATPCLRWSMWWTSKVRDKEGHIQCPPCICYIHGLGHEPWRVLGHVKEHYPIIE